MSSKMPDWSQLPVELLHLIPKNLEDEDYCFDVVHARSVCRSWRSLFPFPSYLLRQSYSLPSFADFPLENKDLCTLKKVPLFLFRLRAPPASAALLSKYFLGGIGRDESEDHMELQCSVKVKIRGSEPTLINILDYQIIPLGYQYRMIGSDHEKWIKYFRDVVFLPLNKEGEGGEFIVLLNYSDVLLVLTSAEMRWKRLTNVPDYQCMDLVTFRGRFYAAFLTGKIVVIDPYSLEVTPLMPLQPLRSSDHLIPSGNDELFLVEHFNPFPEADELDFSKLACRVSRLDEDAGKWVEVSDLGDRVLFIGNFGNVCCSAKELPDGCGVSGNSILFTNIGNVTFAYKYGVQTGRAEDVVNTWRSSTQNRVTILSTSPVLALRLEC